MTDNDPNPTMFGLPVRTDVSIQPGSFRLVEEAVGRMSRKWTAELDAKVDELLTAPPTPLKYGHTVTIDRADVEHSRTLDTLAIRRAQVDAANRGIVRRIKAEAHTAGLPDDVAVEVCLPDDVTGVRVALEQTHDDTVRGLTFLVDATEVRRIIARMYLGVAEYAACHFIGRHAARAWARRYPEETPA
ncbi:MAG: hypothetical protein RR101_15380 [Burkholderiaceae bacterium]